MPEILRDTIEKDAAILADPGASPEEKRKPILTLEYPAGCWQRELKSFPIRKRRSPPGHDPGYITKPVRASSLRRECRYLQVKIW